MAGTNEFLTFATEDSNPLVMPLAQYEVSLDRIRGQEGVAKNLINNRALRSSANMAHAIGEIIASAGMDALDDGDFVKLVANIQDSYRYSQFGPFPEETTNDLAERLFTNPFRQFWGFKSVKYSDGPGPLDIGADVGKTPLWELFSIGGDQSYNVYTWGSSVNTTQIAVCATNDANQNRMFIRSRDGIPGDFGVWQDWQEVKPSAASETVTGVLRLATHDEALGGFIVAALTPSTGRFAERMFIGSVSGYPEAYAKGASHARVLTINTENTVEGAGDSDKLGIRLRTKMLGNFGTQALTMDVALDSSDTPTSWDKDVLVVSRGSLKVKGTNGEFVTVVDGNTGGVLRLATHDEALGGSIVAALTPSTGRFAERMFIGSVSGYPEAYAKGTSHTRALTINTENTIEGAGDSGLLGIRARVKAPSGYGSQLLALDIAKNQNNTIDSWDKDVVVIGRGTLKVRGTDGEFVEVVSNNQMQGGMALQLIQAMATSNWTARTVPTPANTVWYKTAWSPKLGLFCTVGTYNGCTTSPDGVNWTLRTITTGTWWNVVWSPELEIFCAVGASVAAISVNGINWTAGSGSNGFGLAWSPELGLFCSVYSSNANTSSNGVNWTIRGLPANVNARYVAWSSKLGLFCVVGISGTAVSSDGINWTAGSGPNISAAGICWSPELELFCVVGIGGIVISPDAVNWISVTNPNTIITWHDVAWSPELGLFLANGVGTAATSVNGVDWIMRNTRISGLGQLCWSPKLGAFCAIGNTTVAATSLFVGNIA